MLLNLENKFICLLIATLLVAIATGYVQLWSHASGGGIISSFDATHSKNDYVVSMATDRNNDYLITGIL